MLLDLDSRPPLASCPSTQQICRELALEGAPEGTCVRSLEQTAGQGRGRNSWHSPAGMGLWMSFLLRPRVDTGLWPALTALTALAAAAALEALRLETASAAGETGSASDGGEGGRTKEGPAAGGGQGGAPGDPASWRAMIKWPNDLFGRHGKLGGILAETAGGGVVIGLGLNLFQEAGDFPPELRGKASSLKMEGFAPVPDAEVAARSVNQGLTQAYRRFQNGDLEFLRQGLLERFWLRGALVRVDHAGGATEGTARDLGPLGELILETPGGRESLISGEAVLVRRPGGEPGG